MHFRTGTSDKFQSGDETIEAFKNKQKMINTHLTEFFSPEVLTDDIFELEIKPVPVGKSGLAYYEGANYDKTRKGAFYINTQNPDNFSPFEITTFTLHEGNPGHHLQLTVANNAKGLPIFATKSMSQYRSPAGPGAYGSYTEGWALYTESLGRQMEGIYKGNQIFGYYSANLLRASRLVVDTGIHVLGWTRQEAIDYLLANTFMSEPACEGQIDRYITWPGQSLSYKMGERKIKDTLKRIQTEVAQNGGTFDLVTFHDAILKCNGPLVELDECVDVYLAKISSNSS